MRARLLLPATPGARQWNAVARAWAFGMCLLKPPGNGALDGRAKRRLEWWLAERRILGDLAEDHERGGYRASAPAWRRLKAEARQRARSG